MKLSRPMLLLASLILGIAVTTSGFWLYIQGPVPFLTTLTLSRVNNLTLESGQFANCSLGFPPGYKKLIVNMTISASLNFTGSEFSAFLLNETQFENLNGSNLESTLKIAPPNSNFSLQVEPDEYYLVLNGTVDRKYVVSCVHHAEAALWDFDYGRVWQYLCLTLAGIVAMNVSIFLMKRERMFGRLEVLGEKMCRPWVKLPMESSREYMAYQSDSYRRFFKPLLSFCILYLPIIFMACIFLEGYTRYLRETYPYSGLIWDYVYLSTITVYPLFLFLFCVCIPLLAFDTFRERDLTFALSRRLGILKKSYLDNEGRMGFLTTATLRKKKIVAIIATPIGIVGGIFLAFRDCFVLPEQYTLTQLTWAIIGMLIAYYGLVFTYYSSKIAYQTLGHSKKSQIDTYRKNTLLGGVVSSSCSAFFFMMICVLVIIVLCYGWWPILSSSLAAKYGLVPVRTTDPTAIFFLLAKIALFGYLLFTLIFQGISGYLVPTLLEKGIRGPIVAFTALLMTFLTDRLLSFTLKPYVDTDLMISFLPSFAVFILVLIFERFFKRILRTFEKS